MGNVLIALAHQNTGSEYAAHATLENAVAVTPCRAPLRMGCCPASRVDYNDRFDRGDSPDV
jgi:hypothetical protein